MPTIIVGCGTIGLATGVALYTAGEEIYLFDINPHRLSEIQGLNFDNEEPEFLKQLEIGLRDSRIKTCHLLTVQESSCNYIICLPTPSTDVSIILETLLSMGSALKHGDFILIRSTVPIGTVRNIQSKLLEATGKYFLVVSAPDRSVEGKTYSDQFTVPNLIGGIDEESRRRAKKLFIKLGKVVDLGQPENAEAAKLFCNSWRAATFALSNAMALIAEDHNLDFHEIIEGTSKDYPRFKIPRPGLVGGPCLPKDIKMLIESEADASTRAFLGVFESEMELEHRILQVAKKHLKEIELDKPRVGVLGLAFKGFPTVSDARDSPSLNLAKSLMDVFPSIEINGWDPLKVDCGFDGLKIHDEPDKFISECDLIILGHEHPEVINYDLFNIKKGCQLIDLTGKYDSTLNKESSLKIWSLGRKNA